MRLLGAAVLLGLAAGPVMGEARYSILDYGQLDGWVEDNHDAALSVFLETCPDLDDPEWSSLCAFAQQTDQARAFFELFFKPVLIDEGKPALFTGYFEPELRGSRVRTAQYRFPIYRKPDEVNGGEIWYSRGEIEERQVLQGRGLEIAWMDDPVDVFFLQVQGSGRISLTDGGAIRVGYGGRNGHEYRSVGQEMVRRGIYAEHQVSAQVIRSWVGRNPEEGAALLRHNPSFIFFREIDDVPPERGPKGAMNRSVTTLRTIAVDPAFTPLGAPVWIEKDGVDPLRRLMVAQDTGSAIKGAQRADIFYGTGAEAGRVAGRIRDPGRMIVLLPIAKAFALAPEG